MLDAHLQAAPAGMRGFDCNVRITGDIAKAFYDSGYQFALRYVPRLTRAKHDLTQGEVVDILSAGLGLMVVQHVEPGLWEPTAAKGMTYGQVAAREAIVAGLPPGTMVWLDLESVQGGDPIGYANRWHSEVAAAGFLPGLYVGWKCGISAHDLYYRLRFTHYWGAYNLNRDEWPIVRGLQMKQGIAPAGKIAGVEFDTNITSVDLLGGHVQLLAPLGI